jgi:hypothetical protein
MSSLLKFIAAHAAALLVLADTASAQAPGGAATWRIAPHGTLTVDGEPFFPIGVTMPPPLGSTTPWGRDAVAELARAGVNLFRTGPIAQSWTTDHLTEAAAWNDAAAEHSAYTWLQLRGLALLEPGSSRTTFLRRVIETLGSHPGMGFWKGWDEPYPRYRPRDLRYAYDLAKREDPNHLFTTVFAPRSRDGTLMVHGPQPPDLRAYRRVTDVVGVDVYPIYYQSPGKRPLRLQLVGDWTRAIRQATRVRAVTTTLQICFAGSDDPRGSGRFLLPTRGQERFMAYDAIVNGARGLVFYGGQNAKCHSRSDRARGWNWTFWRRALRPLVNELGAGSPLNAALLRPETTRRLATGDARTQAISRRVGDTVWVIVTNRRSAPATVTVRGLPSWTRTGRTHPGGRRVRAGDGRLRVELGGWGVQVVRFVRPTD